MAHILTKHKVFQQISLLSFLASLFLFLCFVFPRSYSIVKAPFLVLFAVLALFIIGLKVRLSILFFYLSLSIVGLIGVSQGLASGGAAEGILDSFRLWVVWSFVLFTFFNYFSYIRSFNVIDSVVVWSGIFISIINISFTITSYYGYDIFPTPVREALELRVGFHSSYIQLTTHNIGMLFFITPYLIGRFYLKNISYSFSLLHLVSLFLCIVTVIISGRRALWAVTLMSFFSIIPISFLTFRKSFFNVNYTILLLCSLLSVPFIFLQIDNLGFYNHFESAFSKTSERSIQAGYLIKGFLESPVLGQGFGSYAGYTRNIFSPWSYEMTYHQLIFNLGIFGVTFIFIVCLYYFFSGLTSCNREKGNGVVKLSILFGLLGITIGAYSNPYFGSFDFMILLGFLPLIESKKSSCSKVCSLNLN